MFSPSRWYKTWRHGRGFGVHPPLAYHLVKDVLRPRADARYYGEADARSLFSGRAGRRTAATVFRLLADRNPGVVAILARGERAELWRKVALLALPKARLTKVISPECEFVLVDDPEAFEMPPHPAPGDFRGVFTIFTRLSDKRLREILREHFIEGPFTGLILDSQHEMAVAVERHGLPRQCISARF